ncbi:hypothetical protein GUJ93_ZPchr0013g36053 [Zizania palustris]|uniref:Uncharacterized protein n=1 Tax=Zizania palustris TaxID=103762 RepID=A0A8J5WUU0_ZIZPA|nr:hypothetical protein GUJ93_ZPchr0013g36053 [Zizania palustris]
MKLAFRFAKPQSLSRWRGLQPGPCAPPVEDHSECYLKKPQDQDKPSVAPEDPSEDVSEDPSEDLFGALSGAPLGAFFGALSGDLRQILFSRHSGSEDKTSQYYYSTGSHTEGPCL